jgi:hypothetical protein
VPYEDIEHLVAIETSGGAGRVGFTWMRLEVSTDADGNETYELAGVLRRSFDPAEFPDADSDWVSYETGGGAPYPGVTVGYVMDTALSEDAARHARPWSWDFGGTVDSAGQPWDVVFSRSFRMQELGRLLDECVSIEGEPHMTPAGVLRLFRRRGVDRTATVTVTSPFDLSLSGRGPQATRWLFETADGFGQIVNAQAETALGVVLEQFVQLGTDINPEAIGPALTKQLAEDGRTLDEVLVDLPDGVVPYQDVHLGDTVLCDGRDGTAPVRLTSFEFEEDDVGGHVWRATGLPV